MNPLDRESRAARYLDAMQALQDILARCHPREAIEAEPLCQLLGLLNDEGRKVMPRHSPDEREPGLVCDND